MLTVPNVYASEDNCDENPNDSLCNGDRGIEGLIFCVYHMPYTDALYHIPYTTLDIYLPLVNVYATPYRLKYLVLGQGLSSGAVITQPTSEVQCVLVSPHFSWYGFPNRTTTNI